MKMEAAAAGQVATRRVNGSRCRAERARRRGDGQGRGAGMQGRNGDVGRKANGKGREGEAD